MKRILVIPSGDYLGRPFPQRENQIFERVHDGQDFEVHVIRFDISGETRIKSKCIIHELPIELRLRAPPLYYLTNAPLYTNEIMKIVKQESIDVMIFENLLPPLLFEILGQISTHKIPLIFDIQDYFPTSATGYVCDVKSSLGVMFKGLFESLMRFLIRMSSVITVPGIALYSYIKTIAPSKKVFIIPNGISEYFMKKYNGYNIREKLGFHQEDIIVGYTGSIEFWLDLKSLIRAIARLHKHKFPIKLLLIGKYLHTNYWKKVNDWIKEYEIENITEWLGPISHEKLPEYISAFNVGTIPFDITNPTSYYAAPIKMWEYLSQGVEVAATPIPEMIFYRNIVKIVSDDNDYINVIKDIKMNKNLQDKKILEIRPLLMKRTWSYSANLMKKVINSIITSHT